MTPILVQLKNVVCRGHDEDGHDKLCRTTFTYSSDDPYAIHLAFHAENTVSWTFARDILRDGLTRSFPLLDRGDVTAWYRADRLYLKLTSPDGEATFSWDLDRIRRFVHDIYRPAPLGVPGGQEEQHVDLDAEIYKLVTGDPIPVWLLDVDGVINSVASPEMRYATWPRQDWVTHRVAWQHGEMTVRAARPVLALIRKIHEQGLAQIRWHTTWLDDAHKLSQAFDLPQFPVHYYPTDDEMLPGAPWWKLKPAVVTGAHGPLIWTDDDLQANQGDLQVRLLAANRRHLLISPNPLIGLAPQSLDTIEQHLTRLRQGQGVA